ncbi:hypothetical protein [Streptomyces indicus]|uniref:Uncharacterized protein n=1 Tax=Streptomyces indicus TaxID=417292 RepID=A0A1G9GIZ3_9ACTN|nr:hypothetical protein [Streptomyces indicus]SDL00644.1 hypothetical protein SAMN05421806_11627 [Streptomyces indicus]
MSSPQHQSDQDSSAPDPDSALGEVFKEVEEAETRDPGLGGAPGEHEGEAGDALTPNEEAQEEASGR